MRQLFDIALFWIVIIVAIRVAVHFPDSSPARVLFWRIDPTPFRGERKSDYLFRYARFAANWCLQAAFLLFAGWIALGWDPSLADSPSFLVFWAVVIPLLGTVALFATLVAVVRAGWGLWLGRERGNADTSNEAQA